MKKVTSMASLLRDGRGDGALENGERQSAVQPVDPGAKRLLSRRLAPSAACQVSSACWSRFPDSLASSAPEISSPTLSRAREAGLLRAISSAPPRCSGRPATASAHAACPSCSYSSSQSRQNEVASAGLQGQAAWVPGVGRSRYSPHRWRCSCSCAPQGQRAAAQGSGKAGDLGVVDFDDRDAAPSKLISYPGAAGCYYDCVRGDGQDIGLHVQGLLVCHLDQVEALLEVGELGFRED